MIVEIVRRRRSIYNDHTILPNTAINDIKQNNNSLGPSIKT